MSRRRRNETDEQRARRVLISDFLSAANIQSISIACERNFHFTHKLISVLDRFTFSVSDFSKFVFSHDIRIRHTFPP